MHIPCSLGDRARKVLRALLRLTTPALQIVNLFLPSLLLCAILGLSTAQRRLQGLKTCYIDLYEGDCIQYHSCTKCPTEDS